MRFSEFIRAWKGDRSEQACGTDLGRSGETIGNWCDGKTTPSRTVTRLLAPLLGVSEGELIAMIETERKAKSLVGAVAKPEVMQSATKPEVAL